MLRDCPKCCVSADGEACSLLAVGGPMGVLLDHRFGGDIMGESDALTKLPAGAKGARRCRGITWVSWGFQWQLGACGMGFMDEPIVDEMQSAGALIITVPPASERRYS